MLAVTIALIPILAGCGGATHMNRNKVERQASSLPAWATKEINCNGTLEDFKYDLFKTSQC